MKKTLLAHFHIGPVSCPFTYETVAQLVEQPRSWVQYPGSTHTAEDLHCTVQYSKFCWINSSAKCIDVNTTTYVSQKDMTLNGMRQDMCYCSGISPPAAVLVNKILIEVSIAKIYKLMQYNI